MIHMAHHPQVHVNMNGHKFTVDKELYPMLKAFWQLGFETLFSCQGGIMNSGVENRGYILFVNTTVNKVQSILTKLDIESFIGVTEFMGDWVHIDETNVVGMTVGIFDATIPDTCSNCRNLPRVSIRFDPYWINLLTLRIREQVPELVKIM